jgi:hypothetical protein
MAKLKFVQPIVVTYEIRVFFEGAQKEVFSSILKCEYVKYVNTMNRTLNKLSLSCAQTLLNQLEHRHTLNKTAH